MKKVRLIFGSTNSQPVGTTDAQIEEIYQRAYKPFLRALYNAPHIPVTLHFSGQLLQWLERHHSEYTDVLSEMVTRKQIELLGGGFYDPVLSLIPRPDRLGQIESLTTYLRKRFGRRPRGTWVTEHVWEPSLTSTLCSSGMEYVFLDDYHFLAAGLANEALERPCIAEDQGKTIVAFPVHHDLVVLARKEQPERVIEFMKSRASSDRDRVLVLIDSGERFRDATDDEPQVHDRWLERFVELLEENREWIDVELPAQYLKEYRPRTRGYFPAAPYDAMMNRASDDAAHDQLRERFAAGQNGHMFAGYFRQFLTRYTESNLMYAKMQYTHVLVNQIRGDKYRKQAAREELWRGQSHTAYWHGENGGIYNNRLRKSVYHALIEAEKKTREKGIFIPSVVTVDFDMDGLEESLYQGQDFNAYVHSEGGILFELDYLSTAWNYLDTLSRTRESYHSAETKKLGYDSYPRKAFVDHFMDHDATIEAFATAAVPERGTFVRSLYSRGDTRRDTHTIALAAAGTVTDSGTHRRIGLKKQYRFKRNLIEVAYTIACTDEARVRSTFAPEINLALLSQDPDSARLFVIGAKPSPREIDTGLQRIAAASEVQVHDLVNQTAVTVTFSQEMELWLLPVFTTSHSCGESVVSYQSTCIVPRLQVDLDPGASINLQISLRFDRL